MTPINYLFIIMTRTMVGRHEAPHQGKSPGAPQLTGICDLVADFPGSLTFLFLLVYNFHRLDHLSVAAHVKFLISN